MTICVITKVPHLGDKPPEPGIDDNDYDLGNLCNVLVFKYKGKVVAGAEVNEGVGELLFPTDLLVPVFEEGEMLLLDNDGREPGGGRKPSKWRVEYEEFCEVEADKAFELVRKIREGKEIV